MNITSEQHLKLSEIWKHSYPAYQRTSESWIDFIVKKNDEQDIKKINATLTYLTQLGIDFKDDVTRIFNANKNPNNLLPSFSFCTIFNYLKTQKLIKDEEIPVDNILNGVDQYMSRNRSRYHREHQIKFLFLFEPNEILIHKLLDFYTDIHQNYTIDLPEQKKILKNFNHYASNFLKTLDSDKQSDILKRLDFICSGLNNENVKDIVSQEEQEFSFRFIISVNNALPKAAVQFNELKSIMEVIVEKIKDERFTEVLFKEINTQTKLGVLKFQYAFFSQDKDCIETYKNHFKEFNAIVVNDALNKSLGKDLHYIDLFEKLCFKNKLMNKLEEKQTTIKKVKI